MKKYFRWLPLAFFVFCGSNAVYAQKRAEKWGKISEADLNMSVYPQDSSAAAVILQDIGDMSLEYHSGKFLCLFERHRRIKIFDVKALDEGNIRIPYYAYGRHENINDLDVQLILPNGEKQKVKSDNIFTEKLSSKVSAKKVFIPNLTPGCIIEYRYKLKSEFVITLQDWYFQHEIPTRWSEISVTIPQYFNYVYLIRKPRDLDVEKSEPISQIGDGGGSYPATKSVYGIGNLPAVKDEPFMTTSEDYRAHIGFQLQSVAFPGSAIDLYMSTWDKLAKDFEEEDEFGEQYRKSGNFDKIWAQFSPLVAPGKEPSLDIMTKGVRFVSQNIKWDESHRLYVDKDLNAAFERKTGSSAEINLSLVALLRKAGLKACPMLVSTREHGKMYPVYPFRSQFNSVLAFVDLGSSAHVLDATDPNFSIGQLQAQHYNDMAWAVDAQNPSWVEIVPPETNHTWYGRVTLNGEGTMSGRFTLSMSGQTAATWRGELASTPPEAVIKKHFATDYQDVAIDSVQVKDQEKYDQPIGFEFKCKVPNAANAINEFLYCRPVLDFAFMENPLKSIKRDFPVDLPYPIKANYVLLLEVPKGYEVEELPEPAKISLDNNGGKISFSCSKAGQNLVQYTLKMNLSQLHFEPNEYAGLRKFFDLAAEKTQLQLVLKKT